MEDKLLELVILQHAMVKYITSSFDPNLLPEEARANFFSGIYTYMDVFSMHVLETGIKLPESIHKEINEWVDMYSEDALKEMKEMYYEISNEYSELANSEEKEEVKEDDLDISSEEEK